MTTFTVEVWKRTGEPMPRTLTEERTLIATVDVDSSSAWAAVVDAAYILGLKHEAWGSSDRPPYILRPRPPPSGY